MPRKKRKPTPATSDSSRARKGVVPYPVRVRIVQAVMRGTRHADAAVAFGVSTAVVQKFMALFHSGGMEALQIKKHIAGTNGAM